MTQAANLEISDAEIGSQGENGRILRQDQFESFGFRWMVEKGGESHGDGVEVTQSCRRWFDHLHMACIRIGEYFHWRLRFSSVVLVDYCLKLTFFGPYLAAFWNLFLLILQEGKEGGEEIIDTIRYVLLKWNTSPNISTLMTRKTLAWPREFATPWFVRSKGRIF